MLPHQVHLLCASAPGGLVTVPQLARRGWDRREVAAWAADGLLRRVLHGVYALADRPPHPLESVCLPQVYLTWRAGERSGPPVLSGKAALALHHAEGFDLPARPLVLVDRACRVRPRSKPFDIRRVVTEDLEWDWVNGLRVSAPWRALADTALDISATQRDLRVGSDTLRNRGMLDVVDAVARWRAMNHGGAARLLRMTAEGQFEQESEGERRAFAALFGHGAPLPDCQVTLLGRLRVDFVFLHAGLIIEYYGRDHDGRADTDATRIDALEQLGYRVIVVTRSMLRRAPSVRARIEHTRQDRLHRALAGLLPLPQLPPQPPRLTPLRTILPAAQPTWRVA